MFLLLRTAAYECSARLPLPLRLLLMRLLLLLQDAADDLKAQLQQQAAAAADAAEAAAAKEVEAEQLRRSGTAEVQAWQAKVEELKQVTRTAASP